MQRSFIQTSDLRMHYLQAGTGEPVILIHGFPETGHEWRHQIPALAERYTVFTPDTCGFGRTDKPDIRLALTDAGEAQALLRPCPDDALEAYAVALLVNQVRNDGPGLIEPAHG